MFWNRCYFFLADQINNSCGPKMVRGPDFGKHWSSLIKEIQLQDLNFLHESNKIEYKIIFLYINYEGVFLVWILSNFYLLRLALFYLNLLCLIYNVVLMCNNEGAIKIYQIDQQTYLSNNIEETFDGNNSNLHEKLYIQLDSQKIVWILGWLKRW